MTVDKIDITDAVNSGSFDLIRQTIQIRDYIKPTFDLYLE